MGIAEALEFFVYGILFLLFMLMTALTIKIGIALFESKEKKW